MRLHFIACRILTRELSWYCANSPFPIEITWMPQGLHTEPQKLQKELQKTLLLVEEQSRKEAERFWPDYLVLGYGLCSNGVVGLQAGDIPLVIPRTDDCIGLMLGSQKRYLEAFSQNPGTYWFSHGWMEHSVVPTTELILRRRKYYEEEYGEENADFLIEQDLLWTRNYQAACLIASPRFPNQPAREAAQSIAGEHSWRYFELPEDERMFAMMAQGQWPEDEFLLCPPHHRVEAAYDGGKIRAVPAGEP